MQVPQTGHFGRVKISGSTFKKLYFQTLYSRGTVPSCLRSRGSCFFGVISGTQYSLSAVDSSTAYLLSVIPQRTLALMQRTLIRRLFSSGMPPPIYNYAEPVPGSGEASAAQVALDWVDVRRKLAAQLLKSNIDIHNTAHSDRGLFELKRAEVKARLKALGRTP